MLPIQGAQVRFLVRELDPTCHNHKILHATTKIQSAKQINFKIIITFLIKKKKKKEDNRGSPCSHQMSQELGHGKNVRMQAPLQKHDSTASGGIKC